MRRFVPSLLVAVVVSAWSACSMFKPIDPSGTKPKPAEKAAEKPADKPAAVAVSTKAPASNAKAPKPVSAKEQRSGLADPNIAAMVLALNNTDISYARVALAPAHAEKPVVREFATRMLTDHVGVNGLVTDLLHKLDVEPVDNVASLDLRDESANRRDAMRDLTGYAFDSTYIENEVAYHVKFLWSVDSLFLPAAKNAELKKLLTAVRPAVAAHLAHAEQVRAEVIARK